MKKSLRLALASAAAWCDREGKSTEFMLQYMQDVTGATLDETLEFLASDTGLAAGLEGVKEGCMWTVKSHGKPRR